MCVRIKVRGWPSESDAMTLQGERDGRQLELVRRGHERHLDGA